MKISGIAEEGVVQVHWIREVCGSGQPGAGPGLLGKREAALRNVGRGRTGGHAACAGQRLTKGTSPVGACDECLSEVPLNTRACMGFAWG